MASKLDNFFESVFAAQPDEKPVTGYTTDQYGVRHYHRADGSIKAIVGPRLAAKLDRMCLDKPNQSSVD